ncbi:hypothetical protein LTR96_011886, partial [Exophiala xenobiotica]
RLINYQLEMALPIIVTLRLQAPSEPFDIDIYLFLPDTRSVYSRLSKSPLMTMNLAVQKQQRDV